ncbi:MAG: transglutaminase-like putative cysteine protease [Cognaticolwellia sp.]
MSPAKLQARLLLGFVLTALASLYFVEPFGLQMALAGVAGVALARARVHTAPKREAWRIATALVLIGAVLGPLLLGVDWLDAVTALVLYLLVHRIRTGRGARDAHFVLLFAVMIQLLSLHRSASVGLALVLAVQVALLPGLLFLTQLQAVAERNRSVAGTVQGLGKLLIALGVLAGVGTALLFVFIPRVDAQILAELGNQQDLAGFSEQVELGDIGEIKDNPQRVMQVRVTNASGTPQWGPFYFRGLALTHFDGRRWTLSQERPGFLSGDSVVPVQEATWLRQDIRMEALDGAPVFGIAQIEHVVSDDVLSVLGTGDMRFRGSGLPRDYVLFSDPNALRERPGDLDGALQLPGDLDPEVIALADSIAAGTAGSWDTAAALEQHLRQGFEYTLIPEPETRGQPLSTFLLDSKKGHCEYYATALAVMLRTQGVPARVVNGFYGGQPNELGGFLSVRQSDAHSWVEAWLGGSWVRLDATPAAPGLVGPGLITQLAQAVEAKWRQGLLSYDLDRQMEWSRALGTQLLGAEPQAAGVGAGLGGGGLVGVFVLGALVAVARTLQLLSQRTTSTQDRLGKLFSKARVLADSRGYTIPQALPPLEAARYLLAQAGPSAAPMEELAWLLYAVRYGGEEEGPCLAKGRDALSRLAGLTVFEPGA